MRFLPRALYCALLLSLPASVFAQTPTPAQQIKAAVLPIPEEMRDGARVHGYDANGTLVLLREGQNDFICLADDPSDDRFHVACYHMSLEPFMARGRVLRAEGKEREEMQRIREQEARSGVIKMPERPAALYSLTGKATDYTPETGEALNTRPLYVVYIPYATPETTGLSPRPTGAGAPWLMDAGKPWAHIMIIPGASQ